MSDYQQDVGLTPDGTVTRDLIARLAEPSAPAAPRADHSVQGPLYETGDVYIYTDGSVETVVSADRQSVAWQNANGSRWASPFDFTLATGQENGVTVQQPLSWPLTVGAVSSYAVKSGAGAADPWQCAVEQREKISVAAGTFDTYKILCHPEGDASGAGQSRAWYYAPALRHYVRYVDSAAGPLNDVSGTRSRDLVAISPGAVGWPSEARTGFAWARSHTLESESRWRAHPLGKHRHRRPLHHRPRPRGRQRQLAPLPPPVTGKNRKRRHDPPIPRRRLPECGRAVADSRPGRESRVDRGGGGAVRFCCGGDGATKARRHASC